MVLGYVVATPYLGLVTTSSQICNRNFGFVADDYYTLQSFI
jgi:hypothetical protein